MTHRWKRIDLFAVAWLALAGFCTAEPAESRQAPSQERGAVVVVVAGDLEHHMATNDLFHIDDLWMQVAPDTEFHRWLSQWIGRDVTITMTADVDQAVIGDEKNIRILRGTLMHQTAPNASPVIHILFLKDALTGSLGAVTFQTADLPTALKFDRYDSSEISIVIQIR